MKKIIIAILIFVSSTAYAIEGKWQMDYQLTVNSNNPSQTMFSNLEITILRYNTSSGEFNGLILHRGQHLSDINGRVIKTESPNTNDLIEFERIGITKPYRAKFIGVFKNQQLITDGHFVDMYGNVGSFTMRK